MTFWKTVHAVVVGLLLFALVTVIIPGIALLIFESYL